MLLARLLPNSTQNFDAVLAHSPLVILAPGGRTDLTEMAGREGA